MKRKWYKFPVFPKVVGNVDFNQENPDLFGQRPSYETNTITTTTDCLKAIIFKKIFS